MGSNQRGALPVTIILSALLPSPSRGHEVRRRGAGRGSAVRGEGGAGIGGAQRTGTGPGGAGHGAPCLGVLEAVPEGRQEADRTKEAGRQQGEPSAAFYER